MEVAIRSIRLPSIVLVSLLASRFGPSHAELKVWSRIAGPGSGPISAARVAPGQPWILYAVSPGNGVFKTTDSGLTWVKLLSTSDGDVEVDPDDPAIVLAGSRRSTDGGTTWASTGLYDPRRLAAAPSGGGVFYQLANTALYSSTDHGQTWSKSPVPFSYPGTIAVKPVSGGKTLLVVDFFGFTSGVRRSTDGGATFDAGQLAIQYVSDVAISGSVALTATANGVYRSTDDGASWAPSSTGLPSLDVDAVALPAGAPVLAFARTAAGLARSTDAGLSWSPAPSFTTPASRLFAPAASDLLAVGSGGFFRSTDSGVSWSNPGAGLGAAELRTVLTDPTRPSTILVGGDSGLHRSTDSGATWRTVQAGIPMWALSTGGASFWAASRQGGVQVSTDGGGSWADRSTGLPARDVVAIGASPSDPALVLVALGTSGVFRSTDVGAGWANVLPGKAVSLWVGRSAAPVVLAGMQDGRLLRSTDRGVTFATVRTGSAVASFADSPSDPGSILAPTVGAVLRSMNDGATWTSTPLWTSFAYGSVVRGPATDYLAGLSTYSPRDVGVAKSAEGESFYPYGPGLPDVSTPFNEPRAEIALDAGDSRRALLAGPTGLYEMLDPAMSLTSCAPPSGPSAGGTRITLRGENLPASGQVRIGELTVPFSDGHGAEVTVTTPAHEPGLVDVSVSNGSPEQVLLSSAFTFEPTPPSVSSVEPDTLVFGLGLPAPKALIHGGGFGPGTTVRLESGGFTAFPAFRVLDGSTIELDFGPPYGPSPPAVYDVVVENPVGLATRLSRGLRLLEVRSGGGFHTLTPCRAVDTREPPATAIPAHSTATVTIGCGVPPHAGAVTANVTVVNPAAPGHLRISATVPVTETSALNFPAGVTRANFAILRTGPGVTLLVVNESDGPADVVIDVSGYF